MGVGSICIKDMAGILTPKAAYDLVAALKDAVDLPVVMHTHSTTGMAFMAYLKGASRPEPTLSTRPSLPSPAARPSPRPRRFYCALKELGYGVDLNEKLLYEIADYFKPIRAEYIADGTLNPISMGTDTQCLNYQIPGGMLSNLLSQLKMMNALDKFDEAPLETPRVRKDMGYPPLVTPTSQLIGTQAVQNVLAGGSGTRTSVRKCAPTAAANTAVRPRRSIRRSARRYSAARSRSRDAMPRRRPPTPMKRRRRRWETPRKCEEDVLSYIVFPQVAEDFFAKRREREEHVVRYSITEL